jgi:hypothetical protein
MIVRRSLWVRKLAFPRKVDLSRCNLRTDYQRQTVGILGTLLSVSRAGILDGRALPCFMVPLESSSWPWQGLRMT